MSLNGLGLGFMFTATDLASGVMRDVRKNFVGLQDAAGQSIGNIDKMTSRLAAGLTAGAIGVGGLATTLKLAKKAANVEEGLARVRVVTHATGEEMNMLQAYALDSAKALGVMPLEAIEGMKELGTQGYSVAKIMKMLPQILKFAAAGEIDIATAAEIAQQALRAFSISGEFLPNVLDQMVAAADAFTMSVADLQIGLARASGGASLYKATLTDTLVIFGLMKNVLHSTELAGTATSVMFQRLVNPKFRAGIEALGVKVVDSLTGAFRDPVALLTDLMGKLEHMGQAERGALLLKAFGSQGVKGIEALFNQFNLGVEGSDHVTRKGAAAFKHAVEEISKSIHTVDRASEIMLDQYNGAMKRLSASTESFLVKLGTPFKDAWRPIVERLAKTIDKLTDSFSKMTPEMQKAIASGLIFASIALVVGGAMSIVGAAAPLMKAGLILATKALWSLGASAATAALEMWPITLTIAAVGLIAYAIQKDLGGLGKAWDRLTNAFSSSGSIFDTIGNYLSDLWEEFKVGFKIVVDWMQPSFERLAGIWNELSEAIVKLGAQFGFVTDGPGGAMSVLFQMLGVLVGDFFWLFVQGITLVAAFATGCVELIAAIKPGFMWIGEVIGGWLDKLNKFIDRSAFMQKIFQKLFGVGNGLPKIEEPIDTAPAPMSRFESDMIRRHHGWTDAEEAARNLKPAGTGPKSDAGSITEAPAGGAVAALLGNTTGKFEGVQDPKGTVIDYGEMASAMISALTRSPMVMNVDGERFAIAMNRANENLRARQSGSNTGRGT